MGECHYCHESGRSRNVIPALAVAAIAGIAITYFLTRKAKTEDDSSGVDKVVSLCQSAADKLDEFVGHALAG